MKFNGNSWAVHGNYMLKLGCLHFYYSHPLSSTLSFRQENVWRSREIVVTLQVTKRLKMENEALCKAIEEKVGRTLSEPQDFVWLGELIALQEHQTLGVNTLKRVWGFYGDGDIKSRRATLDVLAHFLGYKDYATFLMADGNDSSGRVLSRHIEGKRLARGLFVRLTWQPDRVSLVEHQGGGHFIIRHVENSKLSVGDTFEAAVIIEGEPLYLSNLVHEGRPPVSYVAGVKSGGVHFEIIEE